MTRFDEVARLRELVGRRAAIIERERDPRSPNYGILERIEIENDIRNVAPWLLEAAACFQPGDAERIARIVRDDLLEGCCGQCDADVDMMHRLQKAAKILEEAEMKPLPPPFCLWEEYQRTGEYRGMLRWLKHRAYCRAVVLPEELE